jgi:23S rRNA pseudouridine2605 synthase
MSKLQENQQSQAKQGYKWGEKIRLNKYIAHCGFCSRREADEYIAAGKVEVNDETTSILGTKVQPDDRVKVDGQTLSLEKFTYILLNKPKDTITTTEDPRGRTTVMNKIENATGKRVYPVGRLDRNTTGLLLLSNDGDLAHRLMHPRYTVQKVYKVQTKRPLHDDELLKMQSGIELEDGMARAHRISRTENGFTLLLFEGRNRLVRRMVEYFGTEATSLKRINYAGLTLKNLRLSRWRYLRSGEANALRKMVKLKSLHFD